MYKLIRKFKKTFNKNTACDKSLDKRNWEKNTEFKA
jgi:hypothetical protein